MSRPTTPLDLLQGPQKIEQSVPGIIDPNYLDFCKNLDQELLRNLGQEPTYKEEPKFSEYFDRMEKEGEELVKVPDCAAAGDYHLTYDPQPLSETHVQFKYSHTRREVLADISFKRPSLHFWIMGTDRPESLEDRRAIFSPMSTSILEWYKEAPPDMKMKFKTFVAGIESSLEGFVIENVLDEIIASERRLQKIVQLRVVRG